MALQILDNGTLKFEISKYRTLATAQDETGIYINIRLELGLTHLSDLEPSINAAKVYAL